MMTADLTVGLIGCGNWGRHILRDLRSLGCAVHVVAPSEASRQTAESLGAASVVPNLDLLPTVAGMVIAVPTVLHAAFIEASLPRGVPIFVEKPMTADVASARRIAALGGDQVFVMHKWRYHPGVLALADIAAGGELGPVHGMRLVQVDWGNPHSDVDVAWILAPHCLSIALAVLGSLPDPVSAIAEIHDGQVVGLMASMGKEPWVTMEVSARFPDKIRDFRLFCRDGVARLSEGYADHIEIAHGRAASTRDRPRVERRAISTELPLYVELAEFVSYLRGGDRPRCDAAEGLRIVEAVAALRRCAGLPG